MTYCRICDLTILNRYVEVYSDEDTLIFKVEVGYRELVRERHGCLSKKCESVLTIQVIDIYTLF